MSSSSVPCVLPTYKVPNKKKADRGLLGHLIMFLVGLLCGVRILKGGIKFFTPWE